MASSAKVSAEELLRVLAEAVVALAMTVPPVIVNAPAKLGLRPSVWVATAALFAIAPVLVVLATVKVVAEAIVATYQPAPAERPVPLIGWPTTRLAVLPTVSVFPVLAVTAIEAREPVTVPRVIEVPVLVAFWLSENCVALII